MFAVEMEWWKDPCSLIMVAIGIALAFEIVITAWRKNR